MASRWDPRRLEGTACRGTAARLPPMATVLLQAGTWDEPIGASPELERLARQHGWTPVRRAGPSQPPPRVVGFGGVGELGAQVHGGRGEPARPEPRRAADAAVGAGPLARFGFRALPARPQREPD